MSGRDRPREPRFRRSRSRSRSPRSSRHHSSSAPREPRHAHHTSSGYEPYRYDPSFSGPSSQSRPVPQDFRGTSAQYYSGRSQYPEYGQTAGPSHGGPPGRPGDRDRHRQDFAAGWYPDEALMSALYLWLYHWPVVQQYEARVVNSSNTCRLQQVVLQSGRRGQHVGYVTCMELLSLIINPAVVSRLANQCQTLWCPWLAAMGLAACTLAVLPGWLRWLYLCRCHHQACASTQQVAAAASSRKLCATICVHDRRQERPPLCRACRAWHSCTPWQSASRCNKGGCAARHRAALQSAGYRSAGVLIMLPRFLCRRLQYQRARQL